SWLNVAEIELSVLARQCLDRRIASAEELRREGAAWEAERNERAVEGRWRFTTAEARIQLHRLYPSLPWWWSTRLLHAAGSSGWVSTARRSFPMACRTASSRLGAGGDRFSNSPSSTWTCSGWGAPASGAGGQGRRSQSRFISRSCRRIRRR